MAKDGRTHSVGDTIVRPAFVATDREHGLARTVLIVRHALMNPPEMHAVIVWKNVRHVPCVTKTICHGALPGNGVMDPAASAWLTSMTWTSM
jgi:hypothetical protein